MNDTDVGRTLDTAEAARTCPSSWNRSETAQPSPPKTAETTRGSPACTPKTVKTALSMTTGARALQLTRIGIDESRAYLFGGCTVIYSATARASMRLRSL